MIKLFQLLDLFRHTPLDWVILQSDNEVKYEGLVTDIPYYLIENDIGHDVVTCICTKENKLWITTESEEF